MRWRALNLLYPCTVLATILPERIALLTILSIPLGLRKEIQSRIDKPWSSPLPEGSGYTKLESNTPSLKNMRIYRKRPGAEKHPCRTVNGNCQHLCVDSIWQIFSLITVWIFPDSSNGNRVYMEWQNQSYKTTVSSYTIFKLSVDILLFVPWFYFTGIQYSMSSFLRRNL